jgi:hypothetical protein
MSPLEKRRAIPTCRPWSLAIALLTLVAGTGPVGAQRPPGPEAHRREALTRFALKVAAEVKETGSSRMLEPMTSADRKIVHDSLTEVEGITTRSEGEDPRRRVVVEPAE